MEKKWFAALLMVAVLVCACWTGAVAEDEERETFTVGDYEYALLDDGTVEITGYSGDAQTFTIKDMLDGKKVTAIGDNAFSFHFFLRVSSFQVLSHLLVTWRSLLVVP